MITEVDSDGNSIEEEKKIDQDEGPGFDLDQHEEEEEDDGDTRKMIVMTDNDGVQVEMDLQEAEILEYILGMLDLITTGEDAEDLANIKLLAENIYQK